jgi:hypothetical protein
VYENSGLAAVFSFKYSLTATLSAKIDTVLTLVGLSIFPLNSDGINRLTPAETAASTNCLRLSTVAWATRSMTTSWPLKEESRESEVKSLVSLVTPDWKVDLDVGRERTVTLKVPALRRAEMIEGPSVPAPWLYGLVPNFWVFMKAFLPQGGERSSMEMPS